MQSASAPAPHASPPNARTHDDLDGVAQSSSNFCLDAAGGGSIHATLGSPHKYTGGHVSFSDKSCRVHDNRI